MKRQRRPVTCRDLPRRPKRSRRCASPAPRSCKAPIIESLNTLSEIVEHYRRNYLPDVRTDAAFFGDRTLSALQAIERAARSRKSDGRLHEHQHRIGYDRMAKVAELLCECEDALVASANFAELYERVSAVRGRGLRIGELAAYDIAQRLGWYLGIEPTKIYLHCGTREGARELVPNLHGETIPIALLPNEFRGLTPAQVEDILCIYKTEIRELT